MKSVILDPDLTKRLIRRRRRLGHDYLDEVWDGIYVMAPDADVEHQFFGTELVVAFHEAIGGPKVAKIFARVNVSDRDVKWVKNYRIPDVAVYYLSNPAKDCGTHWLGGPDFAVEVISRHDRSRRKLPFYAKVGVRELLLVDRKPWSLELYRLSDGLLKPVGRSVAATSDILTSTVLPVSFRLLPDSPRPRIELTRTDGKQKWLI
jgi:Uma2 family endonuclease